MPRQERSAQGSACVTGSGLNPDSIEWSVGEQLAVAHTIQRDAAREAEILRSCLSMCGARHAKHDLLTDDLYGPREVHLSLREARLGYTRRATEKLVEGRTRHR